MDGILAGLAETLNRPFAVRGKRRSRPLEFGAHPDNIAVHLKPDDVDEEPLLPTRDVGAMLAIERIRVFIDAQVLVMPSLWM